MLYELEQVSSELEKIHAAMMDTEQRFHHLVDKVHPANKMNAVNLLHYLALRSHDIRDLQNALHASGLSSLTSAESHIHGQLMQVLRRLNKNISFPGNTYTYEASMQSLKRKSLALFGEKQNDSIPGIMVTFNTSFADDYSKVKGLLQSGMNVARINCAHDDEDTWFRMIQHIRRASKITGIPCKIYMDLAGPKMRTILKGEKKLKVKEGQLIYLTDKKPADNENKNTIHCSIPGIAMQLNTGEPVLFDDGLIETRVEGIQEDKAVLRIVRISSNKPFIKTKKGINFPESGLVTSALTKFDKKCLPFIMKNADLVGYSFVRTAADIAELRKEQGPQKNVHTILKIETPEAVRNLPELLFCAMEEEHTGVMIARGDLAVEIGFERMSEIQEEILWICEAAHVPVVWATQVLDNLNKSGIATRSEITDAAHASRADCVMINKGNHIIRVLETLKDILYRTGSHHIKKRYLFRPLSIATRFMERQAGRRETAVPSLETM